MNKNRLAFLQKYIDEQNLDRKKNSAILCDTNGRIISLAGFSYDIGLVKPQAGSNIEDLHPAFVGLFPFKDEVLVLPNIETQPGVYWDIHLLRGNKLCWIIFEEKSEIISRYLPNYQRRNSLNYLKESQQDADDARDILGLLETLVLKKRTETEWELVGTPPTWFSVFFPKSKILVINQALIRTFPFLEPYLADLQSFEAERYTEVWTSTEGELDYHFRAQLLGHENAKYLVIKKLHPELDIRQNVIQHARSQTLAYEELKKSASLAIELNQTKEQFISIISHDLRSPFISIISALDYLFEDEEFAERIKPDHREFLDYIHDDSKRLLDYLEKLLDWTRLNTGKLEPVIQEVKLVELFKLTKAQFETRLQDKEIKLVVNIPEDFVFQADKTLFSQVINNLIGNAIKFTPRGGTITFSASNLGGRREIRIQDTGVGIPAEKIDTLFKEYEKYYTYGTDGEKGTGLGLSITKKILDVHQYKIRCESEIEKGTEFIIVL